MKYNEIILKLFLVYIIAGIGIFVIGFFETLKLTTFDIVETDIFGNYSYICSNPSQTISNCESIDTSQYSTAYSQYLEIKNDTIMDNTYLIIFLNGGIFLGLLYWLFSIINLAKTTTRPIGIIEILVNYSNLMILFIYIIGIFFTWIKDILVNQLIIILFQDIYSSVYMFQIIDSYFIWLILLGYFLFWVINEIRFLNLFE